MFDSVFAQPTVKSSLVYLWVSNPQLHTPYISSPSRYLLFTTHVHGILTYFAVALTLCPQCLVSLRLLSHSAQ